MNEREFESKVVQLRKKAVATCQACGASLTQAEDVAQDVMLRLWQLRESLDRYRSLEALVVVMARHNLSSMRRNDRSSLGIENSTARSLLSKARVKLLNEIKKRNQR